MPQPNYSALSMPQPNYSALSIATTLFLCSWQCHKRITLLLAVLQPINSAFGSATSELLSYYFAICFATPNYSALSSATTELLCSWQCHNRITLLLAVPQPNNSALSSATTEFLCSEQWHYRIALFLAVQ